MTTSRSRSSQRQHGRQIVPTVAFGVDARRRRHESQQRRLQGKLSPANDAAADLASRELLAVQAEIPAAVLQVLGLGVVDLGYATERAHEVAGRSDLNRSVLLR